MDEPIIAGNWKMYKTAGEAVEMVEELSGLLAEVKGVQTVVCPAFTSLMSVAAKLKELGSSISLGAQNMSWAPEGAFTGEIAPRMIKDCGCRYVIIGHSERRLIFGENDELVNKKAKTALAHDLIPIICVGEQLAEREAGMAQNVVRLQIEGSLAGLDPKQSSWLVIAYEPVWAIGTGRVASAADAQEMIAYIRKLLQGLWGTPAAQKTPILYGGSVKPENIAELMAQKDINGALVGGASLEADSLASIVRQSSIDLHL